MLEKWWLLLGFPCGPTTEIQIWSVLELNLQKSCRKKLARVPPSLAIFRFIQKKWILHFCDCTKWHIAILWLHKMAHCHFVIAQKTIDVNFGNLWLHKMAHCHFVIAQNGTMPFCAITKMQNADIPETMNKTFDVRHRLHLLWRLQWSGQRSWFLDGW